MKIRYIPFAADEHIAAIAGMSAIEQGVYWLICALIYSSGGTIPEDDQRLKALAGCHWRTLKATITKLIETGKVCSSNGQLTVKRCSRELQAVPDPVKAPAMPQFPLDPVEWIRAQFNAGHFIQSAGNGLGDFVYWPSDWEDLRNSILERDKFRCLYCGGDATCVDHVLPKCQGGLTVERNLVAACKSCNSRKGGRL